MRNKRSNQTLLLRADELEPHPTAQRMCLIGANLKRIMSDFDPDAIGTLHVVQLEGRYWIVDGMHRWTAIRRLGLDTLRVKCEVHTQVSDHAAASRLFLRLNDRAAVDTFSKWNNEVQARDAVALGAKSTVEEFGLRVDVTKKDGTVSCPTTLKKIWAQDSGELLKDTLTVLTGAYGNVTAGTDAKLIEGVALVLGKFNGELDRPQLSRRLAKYPGGADAVVGNARGLAHIRRCSLSKAVGEVVVDTYNSGRSQDKRLVFA